MPKEAAGKAMGKSITIPGTKIKVPIWAVVAVGAAAVAALLLFKSKQPVSDTISSYGEEGESSGSSGSDTFSSAIAGSLEDMAARIAEIEAAGDKAGVAVPSSTAETTGSGSYSPPTVDLPDDTLSSPAYEFELIVKDAMSRVTANRTLIEQLLNVEPAPAKAPTANEPAAKIATPAKTIPDLPTSTPPLSYSGAFQASLGLASPDPVLGPTAAAPVTPPARTIPQVATNTPTYSYTGTVLDTAKAAAAKVAAPAAPKIVAPPRSYIDLQMGK
jgi:hypothetical protein